MIFLRMNRTAMILTLIITSAIISALSFGCGSANTNSGSTDCAAPAGSTITINPAEQPISVAGGILGADVIQDWRVKVAYSDGSPMPSACIRITGQLAISSAVPTNYALYQFQYYPSWVVPNVPVDSGFAAKTDDTGQFTFSTVMTAGTLTFFDTIRVVSGTNEGVAKIELKQ